MTASPLITNKFPRLKFFNFINYTRKSGFKKTNKWYSSYNTNNEMNRLKVYWKIAFVIEHVPNQI